MSEVERYAELLGQVKARIAGAQVRAALAANRELLRLYWDIGAMIDARRDAEGWGARVIPRLAKDLANELPNAKGFSERNLKRMVQYFESYPMLDRVMASMPSIGPQPVAQLADLKVASVRGDELEAPPAHPSVPQLPEERCARLSLDMGETFILTAPGAGWIGSWA